MAQRSNAETRDIETLIHPYTNLKAHRDLGPLILERGEGVTVYDNRGTPYIEGMAGLWSTALGYGNEELIEAARAQLEKLPFTHVFSGKSHDPAIELAEKIKEIAPCPVSKVFFTCSGSEANDTQIKFAWYYNNALGRHEKKKIISRTKAYHGVTIAAASLTGLPGNHTDFDLPLDGFLHTDCPHHYRGAEDGESEQDFASRLAANLEALIEREGPDTIAAFIAEPVMGAGGVIVPPQTYFEKIQAVLEPHDIIFICDEVITGFGRTGKMWGAETYNIKADTLSMAKALSSAYVPIGAVTVPENMYQAMLQQSEKIGMLGHGFTYGGHPLAAAVACKTIEIYQRDDIAARVEAKAPLFQKRLRSLVDHPLVGEARGVGLVGGLELVADKATKRAFTPPGKVGGLVTAAAQENGLITRNIGDVMALCPPLIISEQEIEAMFDRLETALDQGDADVEKQGLRAA